jgi:hypothetical protein
MYLAEVGYEVGGGRKRLLAVLLAGFNVGGFEFVGGRWVVTERVHLVWWSLRLQFNSDSF